MKVAIDIGGLSGGQGVRGIGVHILELLQAFKNIEDRNVEVIGVDFAKANLNDYDVVHYPYFHPFFLTLPSKKPSAKVVVTIHDLIPLIYPKHYPPGVKGKLRFIKQKRRLKNVDAIITISETSKKDICRFLKVNPEKVHVALLAPRSNLDKSVSEESIQKVKEKYYLPRRFVFYSVGGLNYNKNIPGLIKACELAEIPLVMTGKQITEIEKMDLNHAELRHLNSIVGKLKEKNNIRLLGFVSEGDLAAIYKLATLYCQPSFYEGFGFPVLEAMVCGTPVVASRIQAHVEIAEAGCLFMDPKNPKDMAKKIKMALDDSILRNQLVETAKVLVKNYSWDKTAKQTLEVYKSI